MRRGEVKPVVTQPPVLLIVNPAAGGGRAAAVAERARRVLAAAGRTCDLACSRHLVHAAELARTAAAADRVVVAVGGDGMAGAVAGGLAGTGGVFGLVPGGRGNDAARALGIPTAVEAACGVILAGGIRTVDLGEVAGRPFLTIASLGLDSDVNERAARGRWLHGSSLYLAATLRALAAWKPSEFRLEADGAEIRYRGYTAAFANGTAYGGGMLLAPGAALDDGLLDVVMIRHVSKARALAVLPKVYTGALARHPAVRIVRCCEVRVDASRPFLVYADGEPVAPVPVDVRVLPGALRVLARERRP